MSRVKKFFTILKLELEDTEEDLDLVVDAFEQKFKKGEITDYVHKLNTAVFRNEIAAIIDMVKELDDACCRDYDTVDDALKVIDDALPDKVANFNYPEAVITVIKRKCKKVYQFVMAKPIGFRATDKDGNLLN